MLTARMVLRQDDRHLMGKSTGLLYNSRQYISLFFLLSTSFQNGSWNALVPPAISIWTFAFELSTFRPLFYQYFNSFRT